MEPIERQEPTEASPVEEDMPHTEIDSAPATKIPMEAGAERAAGPERPSDGAAIEEPESEPAEEPAPAHSKPLLATGELIARLKSKGVTFDLCDEEEAADLLVNGNNYLRITSYRKLYERKEEGPEAGNYINLDFGHLAALSSLDRQLREAFLAVTVDVEHFAKMKVLANAEDRGEDGYEIVGGFYASLNHAGRNAILGAMRARMQAGERRDAYAGDLIAHHIADMPVWVFLEVIDFGTFVDFYLFCANRWEDSVMLQEHYVLKSVKALRNATAHNHCIANGFTSSADAAGYPTNSLIIESLNAHGVARTKSRRAKLANLRVAQMASALYALNALCKREPPHAEERGEAGSPAVELRAGASPVPEE